jgi:hypothetical protein
MFRFIDTHKVDQNSTKESFHDLAKETLGGYVSSEGVIIQMVLPNIQSAPPLAHFSFQSEISFLYDKLKWITSLNRHLIFELYVDKLDTITAINWSQICSWCIHNNFSLHVTLPKDLESISQDHLSGFSSSACVLNVPFRRGLRQPC